MTSWRKIIAWIVLLLVFFEFGVFLVNFSVKYAEFLNQYNAINESCIPGSPFSIRSPEEQVMHVDFQKSKYMKCMEFKEIEAHQYQLKYNTSEECQSAPKKILCSFIVANKTGNLNDCNGHDYCTYRIAIKTMNSNFCRNISTIGGVDYCYYKFALLTMDPTFCDMIHAEGGYDCKFHCSNILENANRMAMSVNIVDQSDTCNILAEELANDEVFV